MSDRSQSSAASCTSVRRPVGRRLLRRKPVGRRLGRFARRCTVVLTMLIVLLLLGGIGGYYFVLTEARVAAMASDVLDDLTGGQATVGSGRINLRGELTLKDVAVGVERMPGEAGRVFEAAAMRIQLDRRALWFGRFEPVAVEIERPVLTLAEDLKTGRLNVSYLQPRTRDRDRAPTLPAMRIEDGRFRFGQWDGAAFEQRGVVSLAGVMEADDTGDLQLGLSETRQGRVMRDGIRIDGQFDPETFAGRVQLRGLAFSDRYQDLLPSRMHRFWEQLEPDGRIPRVSLHLPAEGGWRSAVALRDVALTLPHLNDPVTPADRRLRMTDVSGTFRFSDAGIQADDLVGRIAGLTYRINGDLAGYDADAPFDLVLNTEEFEIAPNAEQRYVPALPEPVREMFDLFSPRGAGHVNLRVFRERSAGPIHYQGTADIFDGEGKFREFPYRLTDVTGLVRFEGRYTGNAEQPTEGEIRISKLTGSTAGGGTATITGTISPPGKFPAVDLTITAVDVPLDDHLYQALEKEDRPAFDLFFDDAQYERLAEKGHFIPFERYNALEQEAATLRHQRDRLDPDAATGRLAEIEQCLTRIRDVLETPAFALGGRIDAQVHVVRDEGNQPEDRSRAFTDVTIKDASVVFKFFPYPLRVRSGRLRIEPGRVTFNDVRARGLHGGSGTLNGTVALPNDAHPDREIQPDLQVRASDLPLDAMFFDALPEPQDTVVRKLHPTGRIDVAGHIGTDDAGKTTLDLGLTFADGTLRPGATATKPGDYPVRDVRGELRLSLDALRIEKLAGRHDDGAIDVSGDVDWSDPDATTADIRLEAERLRFEDPVLDLLRPFMDNEDPHPHLWRREHLAGRFDATLTYHASGGKDTTDRRATTTDNRAAPDGFHIALRPHALEMKLPEQTLSLQRAIGTVHIDPRGLRLEGFGGRFDNAVVKLDGRCTLNPFTADLRLNAKGTAIEDDLKANLPPMVVTLIDQLQLQGGFEARFTDLRFTAARESAGDSDPVEDAATDAGPTGQIGEAADASAVKRTVASTSATGGASPPTVLRGRMRLDDAAAILGQANVTDLNATVELAVARRADQPRPAMAFSLNAASATIAGRPLKRLTAKLTRPADDHRLALSDIKGEIYGGAIGGDAVIDPEQRTYRAMIAASDLDLTRMTADPAARPVGAPNAEAEPTDRDPADVPADADPPAEAKAPDDDADADDDDDDDDENNPPPPLAGRVAASLHLEGGWGDKPHMKGRGKVEIREGRMYELPLSLGALQMAHLALPVSQSFRTADMQYTFRDNQVTLASMTLDSPNMRMAGRGTLDLSDRTVDLTFTSSNPDGLNLGPVTDLIDAARNQLVTLRATGPLADPDIQVRQFDGLTQAWRDVFGTEE